VKEARLALNQLHSFTLRKMFFLTVTKLLQLRWKPGLSECFPCRVLASPAHSWNDRDNVHTASTGPQSQIARVIAYRVAE